jgi:hypothetical protein
MNAGCLFTNGKLVLAGYQPNKSTKKISGLGGKQNNNEYLHHTALRETLEELLGQREYPMELLYELEHSLNPQNKYLHGDYYILVFSFTDLEEFLQITKKYIESSKHYETFPFTVSDLIFNRTYTEKDEVQQLCLLPVAHNILIDKYFQKDIRIYIESKNP